MHKQQREISANAQRRKDKDYEYATLDDDYAEPSIFSLENLNLPKTSGFVLKTLQNFVERFVDVAYDLAPEGVSRSVVETTTKGGLVLVTLAFASSILSFLLNAGFVALGLYIATKVFNIDIGSRLGSSPKDLPDFQDSYQKPGRQRKSNSRKKARPMEDSDVTDVWFERPPRRSK